MKNFIFFAALAINTIAFQPINLVSNDNSEISVSDDNVIDNIVMEDDIMLVSTDKSNGNILDIQVIDSYNHVSMHVLGCSESNCSVDVSALAFGRYTVDVITTTGHSFTGSISRL